MEIEVWINSNKHATEDIEFHYYDVEVTLVDCEFTALFECDCEESAIKLKEAILSYAISASIN